MKRILLVLLATGALTGCAALFPGPPLEGPWTKTVDAKEPPWTLVALDGTLCTASTRYGSVKRGDRVTCAWRSRGAELNRIEGQVTESPFGDQRPFRQPFRRGHH